MAHDPAGSIREMTIVSPKGDLIARLRHSGDPYRETDYARLSLDGLPFGDRRFGWNAIWSPCSRYFAISEWSNAGFVHRQDTQLVLIDVSRRRECIIERAEGGCIDPVFINDGILKYSVMTSIMTDRAAGYQTIHDITSWRPVSEVLCHDEFLDLGCSLPSSLREPAGR